MQFPLGDQGYCEGRCRFRLCEALAVVQPDAPSTGGVTEFVRIGVLADVHSVPVSPHSLPELHVHLAAATQTSSWVEHFPLIDTCSARL